MGCIAVLSHVVIDEIHHAGQFVKRQVGGAGAYAAVGAALVAEDSQPIMVAGTGAADLHFIVRWMSDRGIDPAGLFLVGERGPLTEVRYEDDANRVEVPIFGLEHFIAHTPLPHHVPQGHKPQGIYLFHNSEELYWCQIAQFRREFTGVVLWEVAADCCQPEFLREVRDRARLVDVVVLNLSEAEALFGIHGRDAVLEAAADLAPLVLVHHGTHGSWVLCEGVHGWIGIRSVLTIDVTGGGNAYSGAFLQALVDGKDALLAARLAASAAAEVVSTQGAPLVTEQVRLRVRDGVGRIATDNSQHWRSSFGETLAP